MTSSEDDPPDNAVRLEALVETMNRAADEEERALSSTRRIVSRLSAARLTLAARRARTPFFEPGLFGEPAWDIMLFLYVAYREGRAVDLTTTIAASQMSETVGRRWIDVLVDKNLIKPIVETAERTGYFVYLTDKAVTAMERSIDQYLSPDGDDA